MEAKSTFKCLKKKNTELQDIDRFGVTRIKGGWWIRLGHHKKRPQFQKTVVDSKYDGDSVKSFLSAVKIAQENRSKYPSIEYIPESNPIKGLTLSRQTNHSGKTHYFCWGFSYRKNGKPVNRRFGFWKNGDILEKFFKALKYSKSIGNDISDKEKLIEIFHWYLAHVSSVRNRTFYEFLLRSDYLNATSKTDMTILYNRYLK